MGCVRHQQHADPFAPGAAGATAAVLKHLRIGRQIGVDHETEVRQIEAARRDVGGDADLGAAVAQRLECVVAFVLAQLAGQQHGGKAALLQQRMQMAHALAGVAEDDRARRVDLAQNVDDRVDALVGHDADGTVLDVDVAGFAARRLDPQGIALIPLGQGDDGFGHGRGEQQGAPILRRRLENEFEVFPEAEIEHLVGLVEDDGLELGDVEGPALKVIAETARGADDDMRAGLKLTPLALRIHTADAADDDGARRGIKPLQLALDLEGEFAGRRYDQRHGFGAPGKPVAFGHQGRRESQPVGHRLARSRLGGHNDVAAGDLGLQNRGLNGRRILIAALDKSAFERSRNGKERHGDSFALEKAAWRPRKLRMSRSEPSARR